MAILNFQGGYQVRTADGKQTVISAVPGLIQRGPCIQVSVGIARSFADQANQQGLPVPAPTTGFALIDTGASCTCIDDDAAQKMSLPVINQVKIHSASHNNTPANVYPVSIETVGGAFSIEGHGAIGAELAAQGLLLLIGRDVLQYCTLHYNGITGQVSLAVL